MSRPVLVSACLLGLATRYDGTGRPSAALLARLRREDLLPVPVCPEQLAGLPTPRPRCWFRSGDGMSVVDGLGELVSEDGVSMNRIFLQGAEETYKLAQLTGCCEAILKEGSPSCGCVRIVRNGKRVPGLGVTSAYLLRHGIKISGEDD